MRTLAAFLVLFLVAACQAPPSEMTEAEIAQIEAEVRAVLTEWGDAWNVLDLDRVMPLHVQTPEFTVARDGEIMRGFDAFDEAVRSYWGDSGSFTGTDEWVATDQHVHVLSRDAAVELSVGRLTSTTPDGAIEVTKYTFTNVLVRQDGEWKFLLGQSAYVTN